MENDVMEDMSKPGAGAGGGGNNVLSGLALCLLEDGVCLMCVCVCVGVSVYVCERLCERDSVCVYVNQSTCIPFCVFSVSTVYSTIR